MLRRREIIHYFVLKHKGNWERIYSALENQEAFDEKEYKKLIINQPPFVSLLDENYPESLKRIYRPPFGLFYYGNFDLIKSQYLLTSIGTRTPTKYQEQYTYKLIKEVEEHFLSKVVLVSGMAKGLDYMSMLAALNTNSPIIAVLGSGLDIIYPKESSEIYNYYKNKNGLILSEYPLSYTPEKEDFIKRNRIVAGLSKVIYVGGGKNLSGSSTTIRFALEQGKEILALPCNNTGDDLTNTLIYDGADIVLSSKDIIQKLENIYKFS